MPGEPEKKIKLIFRPGGVLSRAIPGYEHREQQTRMALEVYGALVSGDRLIIEAPTGTGKTFAYLVSAALSRKKVAISTGTKNLQEQLFFKDIPFVRQHIFPSLKAALLKGRANFVCHTRMRRILRQPYLEGMPKWDSLKMITEWYRHTVRHGKGDRAEMETLPDDDPAWPEVCSTTETCAGKKCPDRNDCFVHKMRQRAMAADLMVVNHHLLASDLMVKDSGFGEVIPRYEALIVDEAHGLEDAATTHFGFHISRFKVMRLVRDVARELTAENRSSEKFQKALREVERNCHRLFDHFTSMLTSRQRLPKLRRDSMEMRDVLSGNLATLSAMLSAEKKATEEIDTLARRSDHIRFELETILPSEPDWDYACWSEVREGNLFLHASPVDVSGMFKSRLYEAVPSIVFTSATLSTAGGFEYFKSRLGLGEEPFPSEVILDSPFDHGSQTIMYIPGSIPEPNSPQFVDAAAAILADVLRRTRGRAFALFTSHRNMRILYEKTQGQVPFPLLIQGSKPKNRLLEEFREQSDSVLFATSSFWEGVDVQGEALSCVIIDRLPFAHPDEPVISARIEKIKKEGGESFYSFQVPMAVISLKQGLGRLIRTRSDRGVLCILDKRILTKSYGKIFRQSLFETPLYRDPQHIDEFLSGN